MKSLTSVGSVLFWLVYILACIFSVLVVISKWKDTVHV